MRGGIGVEFCWSPAPNESPVYFMDGPISHTHEASSQNSINFSKRLTFFNRHA
jgi:hypothetical protein